MGDVASQKRELQSLKHDHAMLQEECNRLRSENTDLKQSVNRYQVERDAFVQERVLANRYGQCCIAL